MRYTAYLLLILFALALVGCGADSYEKVADDCVVVLEDMSAIMKDIKDVESAKAAVPKLDKLGERMQAIAERAEKLGDPSEEEKKVLTEKFEERMEAVTGEMFGNMLRIASLGPDVQAELDKVSGFDDMPDIFNE